MGKMSQNHTILLEKLIVIVIVIVIVIFQNENVSQFLCQELLKQIF
jgi:hypothetical protein